MDSNSAIVALKNKATGSEQVEQTEKKPPQLTLKGAIAFFALLGSVILYALGYTLFGLVLLAVGVYAIIYRRVSTYHRALLILLGWRSPIGFTEGPRWCLPRIGRLEEVDIREQKMEFEYQEFPAGDGIPIYFKLVAFWHPVRREQEPGPRWWNVFSSGKLLREYFSLGKGVAGSMVGSLCQHHAEIELGSHPHDDLFGFSVQRLDELFATVRTAESGSDKKGVDVDSALNMLKSKVSTERARSIREQICQAVTDRLNNELNPMGIVVRRVAIEDLNLPKRMRGYIQQILMTMFEKASEMIDTEVDIKRVITFMKAAAEQGCPISFIDIYNWLRRRDIEELGAKNLGQVGLLLQKLIAEQLEIPAPTAGKIIPAGR